jgi:hypothetical protein
MGCEEGYMNWKLEMQTFKKKPSYEYKKIVHAI